MISPLAGTPTTNHFARILALTVIFVFRYTLYRLHSSVLHQKQSV